jgi:hypothetical protein
MHDQQRRQVRLSGVSERRVQQSPLPPRAGVRRVLVVSPSLDRAAARWLLGAGALALSAACSDDGAGPQAPNGVGGGRQDAAAPHLPGEGVDETPDSDRTTRLPTSTRSEQITNALDDLRRRLGTLTGRDAGFVNDLPLGDPEDAGLDSGPQRDGSSGSDADATATDGSDDASAPAEDAAPGEPDPADAGGETPEPLDAGVDAAG